jgi:hypothetical protein
MSPWIRGREDCHRILFCKPVFLDENAWCIPKNIKQFKIKGNLSTAPSTKTLNVIISCRVLLIEPGLSHSLGTN